MGYFIYQIKNNDCGIASLKMLLAQIYKNKDFLYYPQRKDDKPYSLKELMQTANKEGVKLGAYRIINKDEFFNKYKKVITPLLLSLQFENSLHMVLVYKIKRNKIKLYDPSRGIYYLKKDEFLNLRDGNIIEVVSKEGSNFKAKTINLIPKSFIYLTLLFESLSFIALFSGMFFVNRNYNFLISLSLFSIFAIFEFLYQRIIILSLKYFDNNIIYKNYLFNKNDFKNYFLDMNNFKIESISVPIKVLSSILTIIFGIFLLGINNYFSIINIVILFLFQLFFKFIENKFFSKKRNTLYLLENDLLNNSNISDDEFKGKLELLNNETYNFVNFKNFKKYVTIFITIIVCLLFLGFSGNISLNFFLFHFFIYIFLVEQFNKILTLHDSIEKIKKYRCLYLYHFNI